MRVEAISPSSGGVDEFLELSVCHSRGLRLLPLWRSRWARHRGMCPMSLDENGEAIAYTFRSTTEAGSSGVELERLEES